MTYNFTTSLKITTKPYTFFVCNVHFYSDSITIFDTILNYINSEKILNYIIIGDFNMTAHVLNKSINTYKIANFNIYNYAPILYNTSSAINYKIIHDINEKLYNSEMDFIITNYVGKITTVHQEKLLTKTNTQIIFNNMSDHPFILFKINIDLTEKIKRYIQNTQDNHTVQLHYYNTLRNTIQNKINSCAFTQNQKSLSVNIRNTTQLSKDIIKILNEYKITPPSNIHYKNVINTINHFINDKIKNINFEELQKIKKIKNKTTLDYITHLKHLCERSNTHIYFEYSK
jgi:hypothetical protein